MARGQRTWTGKDVAWLRANYHRGAAYCAVYLHRTVQQVWERAYRLGVTVKQSQWRRLRSQMAALYRAGISDGEIAIDLGIGRHVVWSCARSRDGLPWAAAEVIPTISCVDVLRDWSLPD